MKFEPALDKPALMDAIRQNYGYPVSSLSFVPEGMVGCHYLADCEDGQRHFVTLLLDSSMARLQIQRLDFTLALMDKLKEGELFHALPAVRRTLAGNLKSHFDGQPLIVYEAIPGSSLGGCRPYPAEVLAELGRLTAQLHLATTRLGMEVPYVERFQLPFEQALLDSLAELAQVPDDDRPGKVELRDFVLPRQSTILRLLERLHELGRTARQIDPPKVLVHTDITPWNILRTPQGRLFIVDWEGAMLAPAEHDLFIFADEGFTSLLAEYWRAAGKPRLHAELFAYYFHRRNLEDVTYFILPILHENKTAEEDRYELDLFQADCASSWPRLDASQTWAGEQIRRATA